MDDIEQLRTRAASCSFRTWKERLSKDYLNLVTMLDALLRRPTAENLMRVNGAWAVAHFSLKHCPPEPKPEEYPPPAEVVKLDPHVPE